MPGNAHFTSDGATATVTLDNPGRRNAVSYDLFTDLRAIVDSLRASDEVRTVVVTGAGADFSVGADLSGPPESRTLRRDSVTRDVARLSEVSETVCAFYRLPQVTVAAIEGGCAGAGLSLAAAADFRIAGDGAVFNTAFLDVALSGDLGGVWFLNRVLDGARSRQLFLDPRKLTAAEALQAGLLDAVSPSGEAISVARELAYRLSSRAPLALRAMKQNLLQAETESLEGYLVGEVERMVRCFHSDDAQEAGRAFIERRRPLFSGS